MSVGNISPNRPQDTCPAPKAPTPPPPPKPAPQETCPKPPQDKVEIDFPKPEGPKAGNPTVPGSGGSGEVTPGHPNVLISGLAANFG